MWCELPWTILLYTAEYMIGHLNQLIIFHFKIVAFDGCIIKPNNSFLWIDVSSSVTPHILRLLTQWEQEVNDTGPRAHGGFKRLHPHPLMDKLVDGLAFYRFVASFMWDFALPERPKIKTICLVSYWLIKFLKLPNCTPLHFSIHHLEGWAFSSSTGTALGHWW